MTKKDTTKLINHRLLALGVDIKTKSLNPTIKKRISADLNKERNKLKQVDFFFFLNKHNSLKVSILYKLETSAVLCHQK